MSRDSIIYMRQHLFIMAWLHKRYGKPYDVAMFNTIANDLILAQKSEPETVEYLKKSNKDWDTDWENWDGDIYKIVTESPGLKTFMEGKNHKEPQIISKPKSVEITLF